MDKTQTITVAYDRVSLLLLFFACQCICSYDHEIMQLPDTGGMPCVYQTSQHNWATIKVLYRYLRRCCWVGVNRDWDLLLRVNGQVSRGPLGNATSQPSLASTVTKC